MKRIILSALFILAFSSFLFASGNNENVEVTGTVTGITEKIGDLVDIAFVTDEGESYVVEMAGEAVVVLNLTLGSEITVEGEIEEDDDEIKVEFEKAWSGGVKYEPEDSNDGDYDN